MYITQNQQSFLYLLRWQVAKKKKESPDASNHGNVSFESGDKIKFRTKEYSKWMQYRKTKRKCSLLHMSMRRNKDICTSL